MSHVPPAGPMRPFTVDEYHRMIQVGVLTESSPVELLGGWIVHKAPRSPLHDGTVHAAQEALRTKLPSNWFVRANSAITTRDSEPEPDLAVVEGPVAKYLSAHPDPRDIALVVEVADSSLELDRDVKRSLYARAGVPAYWIINPKDRRISVYHDPGATPAGVGYWQDQSFGPTDAVPLVIAGQRVADVPVRELLP